VRRIEPSRHEAQQRGRMAGRRVPPPPDRAAT